MPISRQINALIFPLLLVIAIGILAWLSTRHVVLHDMTHNNRLSLSEPSIALLQQLSGPVTIDVFVNRSDQLGQRVQLLMDRYQRAKKDLKVNYISPEENPDRVREYSIRYPAEMLLHYQERMERVEQPSEQVITNGLAKLLRGDERWLVFLTGHGERDPAGDANFDLGKFAAQLEQRGLRSRTLNLADSAVIPDNTSLLIIASPQVALLNEEWQLILAYLEKGGNLLCLSEPGKSQFIAPLAKRLGVRFLPGIVVDAIGQKFSITQPDLIPVTRYPEHPITEGFTLTSLFANAAAIQFDSVDQWQIAPLILSSDQSRTETSPLRDQIDFDADQEQLGPLALAVAITSITDQQQRIVITGDGDFIANTYLGNGGNPDLGLRMINWLTHDDTLITIPFRAASDLDFEMSKAASAIVGIGFLIVLPLLFAITGLIIGWRRRRM